MSQEEKQDHPAARRFRKRVLSGVLMLGVAWAATAYVVLPMLWRHYEHNPAMADEPKTTTTGEGIPADPLNVGLVGAQEEILQAHLKAGWFPADPITFHSAMRIAARVLGNHPYPHAPVSTLYLWGRKQDLAFEQPVGHSPRQRHHCRFWRSKTTDGDGLPLWLGGATYDTSVGLSHRTGQITHHISPDIDAERDKLIADLQGAGQLETVYQITGVGPTYAGRNGGDWYYTDGELTVGVIARGNVARTKPPNRLPNPAAVNVKNAWWTWVRRVLPP